AEGASGPREGTLPPREMDDSGETSRRSARGPVGGRRACRGRIVMNLEHCRKEAKRLLRAVNAEDADALARARQVLGDRAQRRFVLSDAQHVVATERGYRSWPALAREAAQRDRVRAREATELGRVRARDAAQPARDERIVDTGLEYRPGDPVRVWVLRRERRVSVSDRRAALDRAGAAPGWPRATARVYAELE